MNAHTPLQSINPATGKLLKTYDEISDRELNDLIVNADKVQKIWKRTAFAERAEKLIRAATLLGENADEYGRVMAEEMGKPVSQGKAEAQKCAWVCEYFAENAEAFLRDEFFETDARKSYVHYEPIGVIFGIMPWNFPFWQVFRFAAPTLMAGNAVILKHSENVTGCALAIEKIFKQAGFPGDLFRALLIARDRARQVIEHPVVKGVTLTGSVAAGRLVASQSGAALKKTVMELGGSDPYIILEDADIDDAVAICVNSRLLNSGQSCIAAKRFIAVEKIHDEFVGKFVRTMKSKTMGDPFGNPDIGPQARIDLRDNLHRQVVKSVSQGAELLLGGKVPDMEGFFYPPTVLANVTRGMPVHDEETFGPVAAIVRATDESDAISIANDTEYGLGAAIFTRDLARGDKIAREEIRAGNAFVNAFVKSDPRLPFGGIKNSGYGRELSVMGIREFTNIKTVYVSAT